MRAASLVYRLWITVPLMLVLVFTIGVAAHEGVHCAFEFAAGYRECSATFYSPAVWHEEGAMAVVESYAVHPAEHAIAYPLQFLVPALLLSPFWRNSEARLPRRVPRGREQANPRSPAAIEAAGTKPRAAP